MYKYSGSSLRSLTQIQDTVNNGIRNWRLMFNGRDIGGAYARQVPSGWQLGNMQIDKQFQNLGLGRKLFGGMMNSLKPGQTMLGDAQVSPQAQALLASVSKRPGPWQAQPGLPGGVPQVGVRPVGPYQGLNYPSQVYDSLKSVLPDGVKPYHHQFLRTPYPVPKTAKDFVNRLG